MFKKITALVTSFALVFGLLPVGIIDIADAASSAPQSDYKTAFPIRNQGAADISYVFATVAAAEIALRQAGQGDLDLSEQYMRYAMSKSGANTLGFAADHNTALAAYDNRKAIAAYLMRGALGALALETHDPYNAASNSRSATGSGGGTTSDILKTYRIDNVIFLPERFAYKAANQQDGAYAAARALHIADIKTAIDKYGAVVGWVSSTNTTTTKKTVGAYWNSNAMTDLAYLSDTAKPALNWTVVAVGYDDNHYTADYLAENYDTGKSLPSENSGAFLCRNSWGADANDNGYFWLSYEDLPILQNAFALQGGSNILAAGVDKILENDPMGAAGEISVSGAAAGAYVAGVFDVSGDGQQALGATFAVATDDMDYSVYLVPIASGTSVETALKSYDYTAPAASGHADFAGYYTEYFERNLGDAGSKAAVVVKFSGQNAVKLPVDSISSAKAGTGFYTKSPASAWSDISKDGNNACVKLLVKAYPDADRPAGITLSGDALTVEIDESKTIIATVEGGEDRSVIWGTSDPKVATVTQNGRITGVGAGTAQITVTTKIGGQMAVCDVTVPELRVDSVTLSKSAAEIKIGGAALTLTATVLPAKATNRTVTWTSSDEDIATVSETGVITAVSPGAVTITASADGLSATCDLTVKADYAKAIRSTKTTVAVSVGAVMPITMQYSPTTAYNRALEWTYESGDSSVATITEQGGAYILKTYAIGQAVFKATVSDGDPANDNYEKPSCTVTVNVTGVADCYVSVGKAVTFTPSIKGDFNNFEWRLIEMNDTNREIDVQALIEAYDSASSDKVGFEVPAAKNKAKITGKSAGEFKLVLWEKPKAADGEEVAVTDMLPGQLQVLNVFVKVPVTKIVVRLEDEIDAAHPAKKIDLTINEDGTQGQYADLAAIVTPDTATYRDVVWSSRNPAIATVDENGHVTAVGPGSTVITAKSVSDTKTASFKVNVRYNPRDIELAALKTLKYEVGRSVRLRGKITRFRNVATTITWESSNPAVATVKNGSVKFLAQGNVTITAKTTGGLTASVDLEGYVKVKTVTANAVRAELRPGDSFYLIASLAPSNATYRDVTYSSNKPEVATVSADGVVTAVGPGTATITIQSADSARRRISIRVRAG